MSTFTDESHTGYDVLHSVQNHQIPTNDARMYLSLQIPTDISAPSMNIQLRNGNFGIQTMTVLVDAAISNFQNQVFSAIHEIWRINWDQGIQGYTGFTLTNQQNTTPPPFLSGVLFQLNNSFDPAGSDSLTILIGQTGNPGSIATASLRVEAIPVAGNLGL